ncbi:MAG TPA: SCO family protein [Terriglobales bacterium]|nr:SCO family protein [Terriglobales bacterium]
MKNRVESFPFRRTGYRYFLLCLLGLVTFLAGCTSKAAPAKHYALHGKVMAVDKRGQELIVDAEAIPGFMPAMTMPYPVADAKLLDQAAPGDEIQADLKAEGERVSIDKLTVVSKAKPGAALTPSSPIHVPQVGEAVPDFALTNQNGKRVRLDDYRGKTLLLTFFYTRCPLNNYCPRMSSNFATLNGDLAKDPDLYAKTHLLSISFDPEHDTPKVLRSYGGAYTERYSKEDFKHWEFATAPPAEMKDVAKFFGVYYEKDGNNITHSLSTAVIGPDGEINAWYPGNNWKPDDLLPVVTASVKASAEPTRVASSQTSSKDRQPQP